ncbi:MAG: Flp pilus assembly protein CpaB [Candidatus Nealsonbacteria bacterium]|nr:Flp pilus assembly protein CpaB [Candidatus Nealsonbacteria bacterium]
MRAKSLALLVLALGCGLVASIGITQVMKQDGGETAGGDGVTIYVAKEDVGHGRALASDALRLEEWPKDKVPAGAISRIEDIENRKPRTMVFAGQPILESMLYKKNEEPISVDREIPPGYRLVGVKLDSVSGGGLLLPKHRVDVIVNLTRLPGRSSQEPLSKTFLRNIKVIAVNDVFEIEQGEEGPQKITAKTAQLLVTPEEAQLVNLASELGTIQLVMRGPEEDETKEESIPEATLEILLDRADEAEVAAEDSQPESKGLLDIIAQAAQREPPPPVDPVVELPSATTPKTWTIQIMRGTEAEYVVLETDKTATPGAGFEGWRLGNFGQDPGPDPSEPKPEELEPEEFKPEGFKPEGFKPEEFSPQDEPATEEKKEE